MKTKKSELIVGIIIILAVLVVVFGKLVITGSKQKADMAEITVQFPQIGGLDVGNTVFVHGVRAGKVAVIALEQNGVKAVLLVNRGITLKKDARIVISLEVPQKHSILRKSFKVIIMQDLMRLYLKLVLLLKISMPFPVLWRNSSKTKVRLEPSKM